jgi:hypothetical protein
MNTSELRCILSRVCLVSGCHFLGVFAADCAPTRFSKNKHRYPCAYVINTDPASLPGKHWVACFIQSPKHALEFFDSYGQAPAAYPSIRLPSFPRVRVVSSNVFQSARSMVCGHYCIYFVCQRLRSFSVKDILCTLTRFARSARPGRLYPQDALVKRYVRNIVRRLPASLCCTKLQSQCLVDQCCTKRCQN